MSSAQHHSSKLDHWLRPEHRNPWPLFQDALARPYGRTLIIDHFLTDEALATIDASFAKRTFTPDNEGLPYDSRSSLVSTDDELGEFFHDREWIEWLHAALGQSLPDRFGVITSARMNPKEALGFWPHVDDLPGIPRRIAVLIYLTPEWRAEDGGLLQLWQELPAAEALGEPLHWADQLHRRLDVLDHQRELYLELGGPWYLPKTHLRLIDQIIPMRNRAVLFALHPERMIHSVTPSRGRERYAILQWIS